MKQIDMRKQRSLKRAVKTRNQKKKIYIFSEGKNTEPLYFKAYELVVSSSVLEVVCEKEAGVPKTLLELAKEKKKEISRRSYIRDNGDGDKVWVVFDRDDHDEIPRVRATCDGLGIGVAFSNPCFEVWLILHVKDYNRDEHRSLTQKCCEEVCDDYSRNGSKTPNFSNILTGVEKAEVRADKLVSRREEDGGEAPLTTVHFLTRAMREA